MAVVVPVVLVLLDRPVSTATVVLPIAPTKFAVMTAVAGPVPPDVSPRMFVITDNVAVFRNAQTKNVVPTVVVVFVESVHQENRAIPVNASVFPIASTKFAVIMAVTAPVVLAQLDRPVSTVTAAHPIAPEKTAVTMAAVVPVPVQPAGTAIQIPRNVYVILVVQLITVDQMAAGKLAPAPFLTTFARPELVAHQIIKELV